VLDLRPALALHLPTPTIVRPRFLRMHFTHL
jgi:hypothetical protein